MSVHTLDPPLSNAHTFSFSDVTFCCAFHWLQGLESNSSFQLYDVFPFSLSPLPPRPPPLSLSFHLFFSVFKAVQNHDRVEKIFYVEIKYFNINISSILTTIRFKPFRRNMMTLSVVVGATGRSVRIPSPFMSTIMGRKDPVCLCLCPCLCVCVFHVRIDLSHVHAFSVMYLGLAPCLFLAGARSLRLSDLSPPKPLSHLPSIIHNRAGTSLFTAPLR
jgi:hypothetical protein